MGKSIIASMSNRYRMWELLLKNKEMTVPEMANVLCAKPQSLRHALRESLYRNDGIFCRIGRGSKTTGGTKPHVYRLTDNAKNINIVFRYSLSAQIKEFIKKNGPSTQFEISTAIKSKPNNVSASIRLMRKRKQLYIHSYEEVATKKQRAAKFYIGHKKNAVREKDMEARKKSWTNYNKKRALRQKIQQNVDMGPFASIALQICG